MTATRTHDFSFSGDYAMPEVAASSLMRLVDRIEANPGRMVDEAELEELQSRLDLRPALDTLPPGLTEDDFVGILKLALLTECATDSYAAVIDERAELYGAPWLARFNRNVWVPDERTHHAPYESMLLNLGYSSDGLQREVRETQERYFEHTGGDTPLHITAYGMVQEYLTDNWHGLIAQLTSERSPEAAAMAHSIKRRETIHTVWYRDMTALQIEANPRLIRHLAESLVEFQMPGKILVPDLEAKVPRWLPALGANFDQMVRDLIRHLYVTVSDTREAGRLLLHLADERGMRIGPIAPRHLDAALNRLGGPGYGLLGEALLEKAGLSYLFTGPASSTASRGVVERTRSLFRSWVASQIELRLERAA